MENRDIIRWRKGWNKAAQNGVDSQAFQHRQTLNRMLAKSITFVVAAKIQKLTKTWTIFLTWLWLYGRFGDDSKLFNEYPLSCISNITGSLKFSQMFFLRELLFMAVLENLKQISPYNSRSFKSGKNYVALQKEK